jgi:hypothetical protein
VLGRKKKRLLDIVNFAVRNFRLPFYDGVKFCVPVDASDQQQQQRKKEQKRKKTNTRGVRRVAEI